MILRPKLAEELLNEKLASNYFDDRVTKDTTHLTFNFDIFRTKIDRPESQSIFQMLLEGHNDLMNHPITEAFIIIKWQKLKWLFYLSIAFEIALTILITSTLIIEQGFYQIGLYLNDTFYGFYMRKTLGRQPYADSPK